MYTEEERQKNKDIAELKNLKQYLFRQAGEGSVDRLHALRKSVSKELEELHTIKKKCQQDKNFEAVSWYSKELIRPLEKELKAINIADSIINGKPGRLPNNYPKELWPELRRISLFLDHGE